MSWHSSGNFAPLFLRVLDKPYVELKDSDGRVEDSIIAAVSWADHLKRNNSIIVDLFQVCQGEREREKRALWCC